MPYPEGLTAFQWAREATLGTDLATTSKMHAESLKLTSMDEYARPPIVRGLMQRNRGFETPVKRWTEWAAEGPLSFEQAQNWFSGAIVSVAAPTGVGPYTWAHVRNPAAAPTLAGFTIERRETDGATPIDHAIHYAMVRKLTLSGADGELVRFAAEGFGRRVQTETLTAAITLPTPEYEPMALSKVFIDSTWANLGVTQVASQILGWSVEIISGAAPIWTVDARSDLDYTLHVINSREVAINARLVLLLGAQFSTEKTAAEAGTLRAVRLQFSGTGSRDLQLDFLAKHDRASLLELGEQDGQRIVEMSLQESTDGTNLLRATLINNVAAFA